jgi:hypothetical protein
MRVAKYVLMVYHDSHTQRTEKGADRSHIPDWCFGPYCVQIFHWVHALRVAMV